jgi:hypothetical protein
MKNDRHWIALTLHKPTKSSSHFQVQNYNQANHPIKHVTARGVYVRERSLDHLRSLQVSEK